MADEPWTYYLRIDAQQPTGSISESLGLIPLHGPGFKQDECDIALQQKKLPFQKDYRRVEDTILAGALRSTDPGGILVRGSSWLSVERMFAMNLFWFGSFVEV